MKSAKSYGTDGGPLLKPGSAELGETKDAESHGMGKAGTSTMPEASFNMINSIVSLFFHAHLNSFFV
jgi:hypothetical protein